MAPYRPELKARCMGLHVFLSRGYPSDSNTSPAPPKGMKSPQEAKQTFNIDSGIPRFIRNKECLFAQVAKSI